jgi:hypothetical protein
MKAITDTLQSVFGVSSKQTPIKSAKRTMLKQSQGQIMTEKDVIVQLEERKNQQNTKKSRPTSRKSNMTKRRKTEPNGMFNQKPN